MNGMPLGQNIKKKKTKPVSDLMLFTVFALGYTALIMAGFAIHLKISVIEQAVANAARPEGIIISP